MAAPTDVRVEAISQTAAVLRWTYAGSNGLSVYRSTDGAAYTAITTAISSSDTSYTDTTVLVGVKYWYKMSDDLGATFSSVVTVITHTCLAPSGSLDTLTLPRFDGSEQQSSDLNNMAERIESALGDRILEPEQCIACPDDGAVVIDCSNGCTDWVVIADENINSITINWCDEGPAGTIEFVIPPNTTARQICGWPAGFGFSGDECSKAPITTGAFGMSIGVGIGGASGSGSSSNPTSRRGYSSGSRSGGGGGGSGCTCVPTANGGLTIKSCNSNNSLNCTTTKSLKLLVCGGRGPYTWSKTGGVSIKGAGPAGSTATGTSITVTPPTNSGSGESPASSAYTLGQESVGCGHTVGSAHGSPGTNWAQYNCADTFLSCSSVVGGATVSFAFIDATCSCGTHTGHAVSGVNTSVTCTNICSDVCDCAKSSGAMQDRRTAGMIAAGCVPCGLSAGDTVSVTDAAGVVATIILRA